VSYEIRKTITPISYLHSWNNTFS